MSRNIQNLSNYEKSSFEKNEGRMVITEYREKTLVTYVREQRLCGAMVLDRTGEDVIGDVFVGRVSRVMKNADTCFVEYRKGRMGFLSMKDKKFKEGEYLPVMIEKEPIKTKPATLTDKIALQGSFFVFEKGKPGLGISKKIAKSKSLRIKSLFLERNYTFEEYGVVVRTQAEDLPEDKLFEILELQKAEFEEILRKAAFSTPFQCVYKNEHIWRSILSSFKPMECQRVITDSLEVYNALNEDINKPQTVMSIEYYSDSMISLKNLFRIDTFMSEALKRKVWLKSGGNLIIEQTESLTAVDVNSAKGFSDHGKNGETRELSLNKEAAKELALQLRLRNISGMILVDFVNMQTKEDEAELIKCMKEYTKEDLQEVTVLDITMLGLMELTRKKGHRSLKEQFANDNIDSEE